MVYSIWQFQPLKVWTQCALNAWCALHLSPLLPSGEWKCIALTGVYEWHSNVCVCVGIDTHTQSVCLSVAFRHCVKTAKHLVKVLSLPSLIPVFIQYFNCVTVNEHELSMFRLPRDPIQSVLLLRHVVRPTFYLWRWGIVVTGWNASKIISRLISINFLLCWPQRHESIGLLHRNTP